MNLFILIEGELLYNIVVVLKLWDYKYLLL